MRDLIEQYSEHINGYKKRKSDYMPHISIFTGYLVKNRLMKLEEFNNIEAYMEHLLTLRNREGLLYPVWWFENHVEAVRHFYNWLKIENNVFYSESLRVLKSRYEKKYEEIISENRRRHISRRSITDICEAFLRHIKHYVPQGEMSRITWFMKEVRMFLVNTGKSLLKFNTNDEMRLLGTIRSIEKQDSVLMKLKTVMYYVSRLKMFFRWMYEEGYVYKNFYDDEKAIRDELERPLLREIKKRYYNNVEIETAYKKYLNRTHKYYHMASDYLQDWKWFTGMLKEMDKTLYTADGRVIEECRKWLSKHEYMEGVKYTPYVQATKLFRIKKFYDWFTINGYTRNHPLQDYNMYEYIRSLPCMKRRDNPRPDMDENVPEEFRKIYEEASNYENSIRLNEATIERHKLGWRTFFRYLKKNGTTDLKEVSADKIREYLLYLSECRDNEGRCLTLNAQNARIIGLKKMAGFLSMFKHTDRNILDGITLPRIGSGLPATPGMTNREAELMIESCDTETDYGIRNRAILEALYSTGIRSNELLNLKMQDVDMEAGYVRINSPKGGVNYQRVVPIGRMACEWIKKYLEQTREKLKTNDYLFVNRHGAQLTKKALLHMVNNARVRNGIRKRIVTHSFRVACATEMLKGNAGIKNVQAQLGHRSINSTEKYIRLVPSDLKEAHRKSHPRERMVHLKSEI